jgi:hypothetical protein
VQIAIKVKLKGEEARTVRTGPADVIAAERRFDTTLSDWSSKDPDGNPTGKGLKYEWVAYMAWSRMKRDGLLGTPGDNGGQPGPNNDFDLWLDEVEECMPEGGDEGNE